MKILQLLNLLELLFDQLFNQKVIINKVSCYCSNCEGNLVNLRTKSWHELLSEVLANVLAENLSQPLPKILENLNIQENDNNELYQPTTLNEQKVDKV